MKKSHLVRLGLLLLGTILISGCNGGNDIPEAENGNIVQVHYTGTLEDSTTFDSSIGREPLQFTLGEGQMIPGFGRAVLGMTVGEEKTVTIPAGEAYGSRIDNLVLVLPREEMPEGLNPTVGQQLQMARGDGSAAVVTVTEVSETMVTLDANHPLAGKDLVFEITLVVIQ